MSGGRRGRPGGRSASHDVYGYRGGQAGGLAAGRRTLVQQRYGTGGRGPVQRQEEEDVENEQSQERPMFAPSGYCADPYREDLKGTATTNLALTFSVFTRAVDRVRSAYEKVEVEDARMKGTFVQIAMGLLSPYLAKGVMFVSNKVLGRVFSESRPMAETWLNAAEAQLTTGFVGAARFSKTFVSALSGSTRGGVFLDQVYDGHAAWAGQVTAHIRSAEVSNQELMTWAMLFAPTVHTFDYYVTALARLASEFRAHVEQIGSHPRNDSYRQEPVTLFTDVPGESGMATCLVNRWRPPGGGDGDWRSEARFGSWINPAVYDSALARLRGLQEGTSFSPLVLRPEQLENPNDVDWSKRPELHDLGLRGEL